MTSVFSNPVWLKSGKDLTLVWTAAVLLRASEAGLGFLTLSFASAADPASSASSWKASKSAII